MALNRGIYQIDCVQLWVIQQFEKGIGLVTDECGIWKDRFIHIYKELQVEDKCKYIQWQEIHKEHNNSQKSNCEGRLDPQFQF